jgi:ssDNA-binding Zn-finger/Zn-ribbon topoisomerase 1
MKRDDLISRAAAIDYLMTNMGWRDEDGYEVDDADEKRAIITDLVNGIHAVDAAPVVHARWQGVSPFVDTEECSNCRYNIQSEELETPYCPWCGAKMDGHGEPGT